MSSTRSPSETEILKVEAERRVRAGDTRADVARDLGVPLSTIGLWATLGGWRRKDIAYEVDEERGRAALARIAETSAAQVAASEKRIAKARELGEAALKAMQAADVSGEGLPPGMTHVPTHQLSMQLAHNLLQQGRLDEAEQAARFALRFAKAQAVTRDREAERWRDDRQKIMDWWGEHRDSFVAFEKYAEECIAELQSVRRFEQERINDACCPTCIRPMEFWPAPMEEKVDRRMYELEMKEGPAPGEDS
jgi:hypothetical protein